MPSYETTDSTGAYTYVIEHSVCADGCKIDKLAIIKDSQCIYAKEALSSTYHNEFVAIAYGIKWCETVAAHLSSSKARG